MNQRIKRVRMSLGARSYDIHIGSGAIQNLPQWLNRDFSKRAFIISDEKLTDARTVLRSTLSSAGWEIQEFPVQAGERLKEFESVYPIYGDLLKGKARRDSLIFALG